MSAAVTDDSSLRDNRRMELDAVLPLMGDDDPPTRDAWDAAAAAVLRKLGLLGSDDPDAAAAARLAKETIDGVTVPALGTAADVAGLPPVGHPGSAPYTRGSGVGEPGGWDIRAHLAEPDRERAAADAMTDMTNGVTSLWVGVGDTGTAPADLDALLADVYLDFAPVAIEADSTLHPLDAARALVAVLDDRSAAPDPRTTLGVDPVGRLARFGRGPGGEPDDIAGVVTMAGEMAATRGIRGIVVDATVVHDAGGSDTQELGYALASAVTYLRHLEAAAVSPEVAVDLIEFRFAATDEQFPTIAKLRAARTLWHRVTELAQYPAGLRRQRQHAVTSRPMMTRYDPWVNMLRTTVAAFAAGVAGAEAVTVLPYDHALGRPEPLARRVARNTSSLLIHESHVARVTDPVGGSYAVEVLTDRLARAAWAEFQRLEAAGGVVAALCSGDLADRIAESWNRRRGRLATRERPITGVSEYPLTDEVLPPRRSWPSPSITPGPGALTAVSYAGDFESLRDDPVPTPAFVAGLGPVPRHTARLSFARNLLTAGGVSAEVATTSHTGGDIMAAYRAHPSPVVVLAGADDDYDAQVPGLVDDLRAAGARWVVVVGRPSATTRRRVDDAAVRGEDAVAFLTRIRAHLGASPESEAR